MKTYKCENCGGNLDLLKGHGIVVECEYCGTQHTFAHLSAAPLTNHKFMVMVYEALSTYFNAAELELLANKLSALLDVHNIYEELPVTGHKLRCLNLLGWAQRRNIVTELLKVACIENHAFAIWLESQV